MLWFINKYIIHNGLDIAHDGEYCIILLKSTNIQKGVPHNCIFQWIEKPSKLKAYLSFSAIKALSIESVKIKAL